MVAELLIYLVTSFGYLGVFLSSLIGTATIIFPVPSFFIIVFAGTVLNPLVVGIIGGIGAAIGEMTAYFAGYGGRAIINKKGKKHTKMFNRIEKLFNRYNGTAIVFLFAATPLPDDFVGLFCGAIRFNAKKFFTASLAGKIILYIFLAYAGFYGWDVINDFI